MKVTIRYSHTPEGQKVATVFNGYNWPIACGIADTWAEARVKALTSAKLITNDKPNNEEVEI